MFYNGTFCIRHVSRLIVPSADESMTDAHRAQTVGIAAVHASSAMPAGKAALANRTYQDLTHRVTVQTIPDQPICSIKQQTVCQRNPSARPIG